MSDDGTMAANIHIGDLWTLNEDRRSVKLSLPPIPFEGLPEQLRLTVDFEADMVEDMIQRLTEIRARKAAAGETKLCRLRLKVFSPSRSKCAANWLYMALNRRHLVNQPLPLDRFPGPQADWRVDVRPPPLRHRTLSLSELHPSGLSTIAATLAPAPRRQTGDAFESSVESRFGLITTIERYAHD